MKYFFFLNLVLIILLTTQKVSATHLIGGELTYECLDSTLNLYQFTMTLYRDCSVVTNAEFDSMITIGVFDTNEVLLLNVDIYKPPTDTLPPISISDCSFITEITCIEVAEFLSDPVVLPQASGGYYFTYGRCCKSWGIINISDPLNTGSGWNAKAPGISVVGKNSSPVFNQSPPVGLCRDMYFEFDHSASDQDGDSLVYHLCAPLTIGFAVSPIIYPPEPPSSFGNVNYIIGFTATDPISTDSIPIQIDASTGQLTGTPNAEGIYLVGICVDEYRNGSFLNSTIRDFNFYVTECKSNEQLDMTIQNPGCRFDTVSFQGIVYHQVDRWSWNFGDGDTSNLQNPKHQYTKSGSFDVNLDVLYTSCANKYNKTDNVIIGNCGPSGSGIGKENRILTNPLVYPNPADKLILIELQHQNGKAEVLELFDPAGKLIYSEVITENVIYISTKDLAPGVYFYKISAENTQPVTGKIVIRGT